EAAAVVLVAHVYGVVVRIGTDAEGAREPAPARHAVAGEAARKVQRAGAQLIVGSGLLQHAVDVHLERLRHVGGQAHDRCLAHGRDYPPHVSEGIPYRVRRVARARRVKVRVDPRHGVEVVLPAGAPPRTAAAAVAELTPWIERQVAELAPARERIGRDGTRPYLGERLVAVPEAGGGGGAPPGGG